MSSKAVLINSIPKGKYDNGEKEYGAIHSKLGDLEFVCGYAYREPSGALFCIKLRYDNYASNPKKKKKSFLIAHMPPGDSQVWIKGLPRDVSYPPMKADVLKANPKSDVIFVEGEKDALSDVALGLERDFDFIVTAASLGEGKTDYSMLERRRCVYYYPDGDDAGYKKAWAFLGMVKDAIILRPAVDDTTKQSMDLDELSEAGWSSRSFLELIESESFIDPIELMELAGVESEKRIEKDPEFIDVPNHKTAGDLFESIWRGHVIYVANEDQYYLFDGSKWDSYSNIKNAAYNVLYQLVIDLTVSNPDRAAELLKLISKNTKGFVRDSLEFFKTKPSIYRHFVQWDSRKIDMTLTLMDGVIDFSTGMLLSRKGAKDEYRKVYLPLECDAVLNASRPNYFLDTMIHGVMPDIDNAETLLSWMALIPTRFTESKKGAFFIGEGNTGKTTLIEIIVELFPKLTKKLPSSVLLPFRGAMNGNNATPEQAKMEGKLLCYTSETEKGKKLSNNLFKELTGGEEITARELYQRSKTFKPTFQILISTNHPPHFDGTDKATYNRILPIVFEQVHEEGGDNTISGDEIKRRCLVEWPGIIKLLCEKAIDIRANGDIIPVSAQFMRYKERYREQQKGDYDIFIESCLDIKPGGFTTMHEIKDTYCEFFDIHSDREREKVNVRTINSILRSRWPELMKKRKMTTYKGELKAYNGLDGLVVIPQDKWGVPDDDEIIPGAVPEIKDNIPF